MPLPFALPFVGLLKRVQPLEWMLIGVLTVIGTLYLIKSNRLETAQADLITSNVTLGITTKERDHIESARTIDDVITTKTLGEIEVYRDNQIAASKEFINDYLKLAPPTLDTPVVVLEESRKGVTTATTQTTPKVAVGKPTDSTPGVDRLRIKLIAARLQHAAACAASGVSDDCPADPSSPTVPGSEPTDGGGVTGSVDTLSWSNGPLGSSNRTADRLQHSTLN